MGKKNYIIDYKTPNISFIQTAVDLKKLGIKNNMFFLKLYDPSLQGVDPHSPFLTDDQIIRIINECLINPWYFLRECVRIPDQGNPAGISYLLNRANLASTWCFLNGIDNYLVIPRQIGKTQSTLATVDWAFLFGTTNSEMMFINMLAERAIENLGRLKEQRDLLPKYLQFKIAYDDEGKEIKPTDNVRTLKNSVNGNSIVTKPSARSVESAERIGRGSTQVIQYYDEFEFTNCIKTIVEAAGPAFATASANAKRNGAIHGRIFTSTPGDLDSNAGQEALSIIEETCRWTEKFYDMEINDVYDYIATNSGNNIVYIEYQYQQLGKDEAWFNRVCALLNNNTLKIRREIFLQRLHGSSSSPYELEDLQGIQEKKGIIKEEILINKIFKLDVYEPLIRDRIYFVGVDVANGYGEDNSAVTIFDPYNLRTVAEFKSANIGVKALITFLYILIRKHLPKSILAIERNHNGEAVIDHLRDTEIRGNIYFDNSKDPVVADEKLDGEGFLKQEAAKKKMYGIWTGPKSRELMFGLLETYIKDHKEAFVGQNIISDIMKLVRKNGKIQAEIGFHDDSIMSFNMCLYLYYYGNNLSRYGFIKGHIPNDEERNKGMDYSEMFDALSENEREYFGITEENIHEYSYYIPDMKSAIESARKGLVDENEMKKAMSSESNDKKITPPNLNNLDPYSRKIYMEMQAAEKESELFNRGMNFVSSYRNLDNEYDEDDSYFDNNLFNELNE